MKAKRYSTMKSIDWVHILNLYLYNTGTWNPVLLRTGTFFFSVLYFLPNNNNIISFDKNKSSNLTAVASKQKACEEPGSSLRNSFYSLHTPFKLDTWNKIKKLVEYQHIGLHKNKAQRWM